MAGKAIIKALKRGKLWITRDSRWMTWDGDSYIVWEKEPHSGGSRILTTTRKESVAVDVLVHGGE